MSWQARTFERLRDRDWHQIGALFEAVETEIPLHYAQRAAMNSARGLSELPDNSTVRWRKFLSVLSAIGVESSGDRYNFKWSDVVRLRYVADQACEDCGGPVIKTGWSQRSLRRVTCLACQPDAPSQPKAASRGANRYMEIIGNWGRGAAPAAALPAKAEEAPQVEEPQMQEVVLAPLPANDQIGEAAAYAALHRLIAYWGPPLAYRSPAPWWKDAQTAEARAPPVTFFWPVQKPIRRKPNERAPDRSQSR